MVLLPPQLVQELQPPEPVSLVTASPGVGKTHLVVHALAEHGTRAVYVTPTHELAIQIQNDLESLNVSTHYWRQGPNEEDECVKMDEVDFFRGLGYQIRFGPCLDCSKRLECTFRKLFTCRANQKAQVLILTSWHLRRPDFWELSALVDRPLVILDEDALSALAAPVELTIDRLQRFIENMPKLQDVLRDNGDGERFTVDKAIAMTEVYREIAEQILRTCATAGWGQWQPSDSILSPVLNEQRCLLLSDEDVFDALIASSYDAVRRKTLLPNILYELRRLFLDSKPVHVSLTGCRWTRRAFIPNNRQILMLDATAEPQVVEGVLNRSVEVIGTPRVEQQATIYQVMDKIGTRSGNQRDLASDSSWNLKLATEVARKHKDQSLLCVTFKNDEEQLAELLDREHGNATVIHYGALRGLNAFEDYDVGLIIGRPMPNEAQLQLMAVGAFGEDALDENLKAPPLEWNLHQHEIGPDTWEVRCQQYADPRWQAVWRHVVTGELMQAIGRLRPLNNDATIYVVTNEPLSPAFDVTAVYAAELFDGMANSNRRSDFQQRVRQYAEAMESLETAGEKPTNVAVCKRLGIKPPNGLRYRKLAKELPRSP